MIATKFSRSFLDTNIFVYCDDANDVRKQKIAEDLIYLHRTQQTGVISIQVLQEFFFTATSKLKVEPLLARKKIEVYCRLQVMTPNATDVLAAIDIQRLHKISFWDAMIIRMAKQGNCRILLTEDLQHGSSIDGLQIVNPFI